MKPTPSGGGGVIRCGGPCRKRFRSEIVTADRSVANALLTSDPAETGLFWFCPECRPPAVSSVDDDPREDFLPPELWLMIFDLLDGASILQVRLTCHRWREIVDGTRALHETFTVNFENLTMDRAYKPENLPPGACFVLQTVKILEVDSWWPSFGAGLTTLGFYDCEVELSTLLGMLKETPNLEVLTLSEKVYSSVEVSAVDFRLKRVTYLNCYAVFNVFGSIFPRLNELIVTPEQQEFNEEAVCRLIRSSQRTLRELTSPLTPYMLDQIAGMSQLKLKVVHQEEGQASAAQLCRMQRYITELHISATNEELYEVGRNLPRLKELDVTLKPSGTTFMPSFLAEMPKLVRLTIRANKEKWIFGGFQSPRLKSLCLISLQIELANLQQYLVNCAKVEWLTLSCCTLSSWSDLFAVQFLPLLHSLHLSKIEVLEHSTNFHNQHNLSELYLYLCNIPEDILLQLIPQCPRLEKLRFDSIYAINDDMVAVLCELPRLKELTILDCPITDVSVDLIITKCGQLSWLYIRSEHISSAARKLLAEFKPTR